MRLQTLFTNESILTKWEAIRTQRDQLDVAIYELGDEGGKSSVSAQALVEAISSF